MLWKRILVIGSVIILMGCASLIPQRVPMIPTRPTLNPTSLADGSVCFGADDTKALGHYILELEYSANHSNSMSYPAE